MEDGGGNGSGDVIDGVAYVGGGRGLIVSCLMSIRLFVAWRMRHEK